ncbi:MAG: hypothetical protein ACRBB0_20220 [Pelagimonas sp.]|uniref:hypothetical protein n=1 Tax=Pelagimonas sp. TaxID=2073170 RepID=UPI003D6A8605
MSSQEDGLPFRLSLEAANRTVGVISLCLPFGLLGVSQLGHICPDLDSLSHYFYAPIGGELFVGALFIIGLLLTFFYKLPTDDKGNLLSVEAYRGHYKRDIWFVRFAGICAFGVALFPTDGAGCEAYASQSARVFLSGISGGNLPPDLPIDGIAGFDLWATLGLPDGWWGVLHYGAAGGLFAVLAYFAFSVFPRPQTKDTCAPKRYSRKWWRNGIYRGCGCLILISMAGLIWQMRHVPGTQEQIAWDAKNLTFWFETLGLVAFGLSWCVKGRLFGLMRDPGDVSPKVAACRL